MSYNERGYPLTETDNAPFPEGYASITAAMDTLGLSGQRDSVTSEKNYFHKAGGNSHQWDIEQGDVVFTLRPYHGGKMAKYAGGVRQGIPQVRSSLNGLNHTPNTEGSLSDLKNSLQLSDEFFLDFVLAQLKIIGISAHEMRLERDGERAAGTLTIQIAGKVRVFAHTFMPVGSLARVKIPSKQMFTSNVWPVQSGHDPAKIPLIVVPVESQDVTNFGMRLMYEFVHRSGRQALEHSQEIRRICAMRNFGYSMKDYAVLCGILFLVQCLKNGIVTAPTFQGVNWNQNVQRRSLSQVDAAQRGGANTPNTVREPQSAGTILFHSVNGPGGRMLVPPRDASPAGDVRVCAYPEEIAVILGKLTGLLEPPTDTVEIVPNNPSLFNRALYQASQVGASKEYIQERAQINKMVGDFVRQVFIASGTAEFGNKRLTDADYEFGYLGTRDEYRNYNGGHIARTATREHNFVRNVQSSTLYGKMLSAQLNGFSFALSSFEQLMALQRSFLVGRVTKQSEKGRYAEIILADGIS